MLIDEICFNVYNISILEIILTSVKYTLNYLLIKILLVIVKWNKRRDYPSYSK